MRKAGEAEARMSGFTFRLTPNGKLYYGRQAASRSSSAEIAATGGGASGWNARM